MQSKKKVMLNSGETRCIRISIHSIKDQNFVIEEASFSLLRLKDTKKERKPYKNPTLEGTL